MINGGLNILQMYTEKRIYLIKLIFKLKEDEGLG